MGVNNFINKKIFIDTAIFIYFIEEHFKYVEVLESIFKKISQRQIFAFTSVLTITECLTLPYKKKKEALVNTYKDIFLNSKNLELVDIGYKVALDASKIRADYSFKTPDAIQLSSAINSNCEIFFTNDFRLEKFRNIQIKILDKFKEV